MDSKIEMRFNDESVFRIIYKMSHFYRSMPFSQTPSSAYSSTETPQPLIPRKKTYMLERKIFSIHSEDRDVNQWPDSNQFQVELPESVHQVESIRLLDTSFPSNQYVFSNRYENTRFQFTVKLDISDEAHDDWLDISNELLTVQIEEGTYQPEDLANEIAAKLNLAVTNRVRDISSSYSDYEYIYFSAYYHSVKHKMLFGNTRDEFSLEFENPVSFADILCRSLLPSGKIFERPSRWGFGSYVGFEKLGYDAGANEIDEELKIDYADEIWLTPPSGKRVYSIEPPFCVDIFGENQIYMELEKYNGLSEIAPYSKNTNALYGGGYNGKVNSAFARIPITEIAYAQHFHSRNGFLNHITAFREPVERITKIKVRFRHHDGRLIDFRNMPFSFTLEFNCLRDDLVEPRNTRLPAVLHT